MQVFLPRSAPSFNNVLVATDFSAASQAAFQTVLGVCIALQARLSILHVFEYANPIPPETGGQLLELNGFYEEAKCSLDGLVQVARRAGVICEGTIGSGIPSLTILEIIASKNIDLAVLGTNALHGFERLIFGSTAEAVLRKASCPVLTTGPRVSAPADGAEIEGPVIFATDFDLATTEAIRYAAFFCKVMKAHVLPRTVEGCSRSHVVPQIMTEALHQVATESDTIIDPPVCAITYGSEISNAVVDYAKQHKAKLIVLRVRQASMSASHIPAHIAFRVITEAPCPILTIAFAPEPQGTFAAACLSMLSGNPLRQRRSRDDCIKGSLRPVSDRLWLMAPNYISSGQVVGLQRTIQPLAFSRKKHEGHE
jgi:nucleotide-binding universal stress UspA family protein